jgi:hypothetical protein
MLHMSILNGIMKVATLILGMGCVTRHGLLQPIRGVPAAYRMRSGTDDLMFGAPGMADSMKNQW